MKKIIALIVMVLLIVSLAGCTKGDSDVIDNNTQPNLEDPKEGEAIESPSEEPQETQGEVANLPEKKMVTMNLEGMEEEREATLEKSKYGYAIYILDGFSFNETETDKSYITMDYDKDFSVGIEVLPKDINADEWKKSVTSDLKEFGEVHEINPQEHFDPYFHDANYYFIGSAANKGSIIYMMKEIDGVLFQFKVDMPLKEAAEGAGPAFWTMLKTIVPVN